ncbi:MAG: alpha/beta fold hydrolase [Lachnospirales bacterium]
MTEAFKTIEGKEEVLKEYQRLAKSTGVIYEEINITTTYGVTYILATGDKNLPPLILLHGSGINSLMWVNEMNIYKEKYRVYAIDIIGEPGKSDVRQLPLQTNDYSLWLKEVFEELEIMKASLIGISLGAFLITKFAIDNLNMVEKLVLLCPAGIGNQHKLFLFTSLFYMLQGERGLDKLYKKINGDDDIPPEILAYQKLIAKHFNFRREVIPLLSDYDICKINVPISLFVGEKDIMLNSKETALRLKNLLPHSEINYIEGAGHSIVTFGNDIRKFLEK